MSVPLVLAAASSMVCVGAVALYQTHTRGAPRGHGGASDVDVHVDARTPEATAESFLDAWRKRAHGVALKISEGPARRAVLRRQREDEQLSKQERELKEKLWDRMADSRLRLRIRESETLSDERIALRGTAAGHFVGKPYERRVEFVLHRRAEQRWRVEDMSLGRILTEMPELLQLEPEKGTSPRAREEQ